MTETSIAAIKQQIKAWEHEFQSTNGRLPSKEDMKTNPQIHKLYKLYRHLKSDSSKPNKPKLRGINVQFFESEEAVVRDDEDEVIGLQMDAELGPTPQANGKVLSIFDMHLTPPESSPLRHKVQPAKEELDTFKTPTKTRIRKLEFADLTPSRRPTGLHTPSNNHNMMRTPQKMEQNGVLETPSYLSRQPSRIYNSPVKADIKSSPFWSSSPFHTNPVTPTKPTETSFQVSPSPLKSHRFMSFGNKKLSDIYNENKSMIEETAEDVEDVDGEQADDEEVEEEANVENINPRKKKAITQKRTTRRWKIKPRGNGDDSNDKYLKVNIHEQIQKMEQEEREDLEEYMNDNEPRLDDDSGEESLNSDEELELLKEQSRQREAVKGAPKRAQNYQRLKINDPRTRRFKRMKRR